MLAEPHPTGSFRPHPVRWDRATSARYWDYLSQQASAHGNYFSEQVSDAVLAYLRRRRLPLSGRVLDFGCGRGFLLQRLGSAGICCEGVDFSERSVDAARKLVAGLPDVRGVALAGSLPTPLPDRAFDLVVSLESVEHILPEDMEATFAEVRRVLRRDGRLVLTTPNEEDLEPSRQMCPECGCVFHRMQHVWSWSAASLSCSMEDLGWQTLRVEAVLFRQNGSRLARVKEYLDRFRRRRNPHLVWIGRPVF